MVTLKDVAEEVGVSIATVSSVINNSRPVADETRKKVLQAINELGYEPNHSAQALKSGTTKNIIYIVPSVTNLVFAQFIHEVQQILSNRGYHLILLNNEARKDLTESYSTLLQKSKIDGLIMTQTSTCGDIIADICRQREIPFTVLLAPDIFEEENMILSDETGGTRKAISHLISYNHQDIGFVMVKDSALHTKRLEGYKQGLADNNIEFDPDRIIECNHHQEMDAFVHMKRHIDSRGCNFTALICCNDFLGFGVLRLLRERNIKVPEEVSLVGYDDSIAKYLTPLLTSVTIPINQMAQAAVSTLLREIEEQVDQNKRIVFPQNIVVRDSTSIAKT